MLDVTFVMSLKSKMYSSWQTSILSQDFLCFDGLAVERIAYSTSARIVADRERDRQSDAEPVLDKLANLVNQRGVTVGGSRER